MFNNETQGWISVTHNDKTYPVRVLKITGEVETLLTSLHQKQLPIRKAGPLYFERWKVETPYDLIRLSFNSKISQAKLRPSYCKIFTPLYILPMQLPLRRKKPINAFLTRTGTKPRQANRNRTIAKLRSIFLCLIMEQDADLRDAMLDKLIVSIAERPVSVVPDRSPLRKPPRKKRFHMAKKSVVKLRLTAVIYKSAIRKRFRTILTNGIKSSYNMSVARDCLGLIEWRCNYG